MIINSKDFGKIDIGTQERILEFKNGIYGYENMHKFVLIKQEDSMFIYMQSIDDEQLAFIVVNPYEICPKYSPKISDDIIFRLKIKSETPVEMVCIVKVSRGNPLDFNINLKCPIIINADTYQSHQFIDSKSLYSMKEPYSRLIKLGETICLY